MRDPVNSITPEDLKTRKRYEIRDNFRLIIDFLPYVANGSTEQQKIANLSIKKIVTEINKLYKEVK